MSALANLLQIELPHLVMLDLGAMDVGADSDYAALARAKNVSVFGFEPVPEECEKLNRNASAGRRFLPYAIGDGRTHELRICNFPMTSSLFEPNRQFCEKFQNLAELMQVVRRVKIETKRLDDIAEISDVDYIKMDIQGAELDAICGGMKTFGRAVVIETEVEFVPLYVDQPLFAEVDVALRELEFMFHRFKSVCGRTAKPLLINNNPNDAMSQMLWADAVYVKNMLCWDALPPEKLLKLVLILHEVYRSYDLCHLALQTYDSLCATALAPRYMQALLAGH